MNGPDSNMRISCLVLRQVEALRGTATASTVGKLIPEIPAHTISSTIAVLNRQGRIRQCGLVVEELPAKAGTTRKVKVKQYEANPEWERPRRAPVSRHSKLPPDRDHNKEPKGIHNLARLRARKVALLKRLIERSYDLERDLLIGILADYGEKI